MAYIFIILIGAGASYWLYALFCISQFFDEDGAVPTPASPPPVSILKPVKGLDPELQDNLQGFCEQDYPSCEVIVGIREESDPAVPVARKMEGRYGREKMRTVISRGEDWINLKVANLQGILQEARSPFLAISDSDMKVGKDYLKTVVGEYFSHADTGMVTSMYKISRPHSVGSALESLSVALDFIPSVLVARRLEGITFGLGASMLVSRRALEEIGGFASVADSLADDYQIGNRLWRKGYRIVLSRYVMEDVVGKMGIKEHVVHQVRWARTYRASRPWGFFGYGITHIIPYSMALLLLTGPTRVSLLVALTVLVLRTIVGFSVGRRVIGSKGWLKWLPLVPLKDLLAFGIWGWSFLGRRVFWRGRYFRIMKDGRIAPVSSGSLSE